jgi:hypothetical protein
MLRLDLIDSSPLISIGQPDVVLKKQSEIPSVPNKDPSAFDSLRCANISEVEAPGTELPSRILLVLTQRVKLMFSRVRRTPPDTRTWRECDRRRSIRDACVS